MIGLTPFHMEYGRACHLFIDLVHKACWALKFLNVDTQVRSEKKEISTTWIGRTKIQCLLVFWWLNILLYF